MAKKLRTDRVSARISLESRERIVYLSEAWGIVRPLSDGDVIEHALYLACKVEGKKNIAKSSPKG